MTVTSLTNNVEFVGDGVTTIFPYTFKISQDSHLIVTKKTIATGAEVVLAQGVDYTFSGIGADAGGTVTVAPAISAAFRLRIERLIPYTQLMDIPTQGAFFASVLEDTLDRIVMMIQQIADIVNVAAIGAPLYVLRSIGGTANSVTGNTGISLASISEDDRFLIKPVLPNTGPVDVEIDGLTTLPLLTAAGAALVADEFHPARYYHILAVGSPPSELRITSEQ